MRLTVAVEPKQISVPDVVGRSQNTAHEDLSGAGFEVVAEDVEVDSPTATARASQTPFGDEKVDRGSTVRSAWGASSRRWTRAGHADDDVTHPATTTTTPAP